MRYYSYVESEDDLTINKLVYSEKEILDEYWEYWNAMMKGGGFSDQINPERCIEDWCTIHWAGREDVYRFKTGYQGKLFCINEFNTLDPNFEYATLVCLNDTSVRIPGYINLVKDMEKVDV